MIWNDKSRVILLVSVPEKYLSYKVTHKNERIPLQVCNQLGLTVERVVRVTYDGLWKFYAPAVELITKWCEENRDKDFLIIVPDLRNVASETNPEIWRKLKEVASVHTTSDLFYELSLLQDMNLIPEIYYKPKKENEDEERS